MPKEIKVPRLTGSKVKSVHDITSEEAEQSGLDHDGPGCVIVIELDSGVKLVALRDEEGNGPGCLTGLYKGLSFYVTEEK